MSPEAFWKDSLLDVDLIFLRQHDALHALPEKPACVILDPAQWSSLLEFIILNGEGLFT